MPELNITQIEQALNTPAKSNWLAQINETINNAKSLFELMQKSGNMNVGNMIKSTQQLAGVNNPGGAAILELLKKTGLADVPIAKILDMAGPYSVNQLISMFMSQGGPKNETQPGK